MIEYLLNKDLLSFALEQQNSTNLIELALNNNLTTVALRLKDEVAINEALQQRLTDSSNPASSNSIIANVNDDIWALIFAQCSIPTIASCAKVRVNMSIDAFAGLGCCLSFYDSY